MDLVSSFDRSDILESSIQSHQSTNSSIRSGSDHAVPDFQDSLIPGATETNHSAFDSTDGDRNEIGMSQDQETLTSESGSKIEDSHGSFDTALHDSKAVDVTLTNDPPVHSVEVSSARPSTTPESNTASHSQVDSNTTLLTRTRIYSKVSKINDSDVNMGSNGVKKKSRSVNSTPKGGRSPKDPSTPNGSRSPLGPSTPISCHSPRNPSTPIGDRSPRDPSTPKGGRSPRHPSTPKGGRSPRQPSTPKGGRSPRHPSTPKGGRSPRQPSTPKGERSPRDPSTPRGDQSPVNPSTPQARSRETSIERFDSKIVHTDMNPFSDVQNADTNPFSEVENLDMNPFSEVEDVDMNTFSEMEQDTNPFPLTDSREGDSVTELSNSEENAMPSSVHVAEEDEETWLKSKPSTNSAEKHFEDDRAVIAAAVALTTHVDSSAPESPLGRSRKRTSKTSGRRIIKKPGLDNEDLSSFFRKIVADDPGEVMMNVIWGVSNLPCAPSCEIEAGVITTDKGLYLLEVVDPEKHVKRQLSWSTENLPLAKITSCEHVNLKQVTIGIFDQSILVESVDRRLVKRFVIFPHTHEKLSLFTQNLKAALEALNIPLSKMSTHEQHTIGGVLIVNADASDMQTLKDSLVRSKVQACVGNFVAVNSKTDSDKTVKISFDTKVREMTADRTSKFEIVQYVIVGEVSTDILPVSNGKPHIRSRALVLTNNTIYLCKEELDSWPRETNNSSMRPPPFPRCLVLDSHSLATVTAIKICDRAQPIVSPTDPLYEFSIVFEERDTRSKSKSSSSTVSLFEWNLCVHDRQYLDQLLACLTQLSNEHHPDSTITIKHTTSQISEPMSPRRPEAPHDLGRSTSAGSKAHLKRGMSVGLSNRGLKPAFFCSEFLFNFTLQTNYQRLKFFKKHVAQAEFIKSDEVPLSVFLAHCSTSSPEYVEVEACVITSNYAIYLLSDVDNIQLWLDGGGNSSFQRRSLVDRNSDLQIRCFYRLWLSDIKEIQVGMFYSSVSVTDMKEQPSMFTIHTENPSSTLSFLSALSCIVDLHDTAEEKAMDKLMEEYIDVTDEPGQPDKLKKGDVQDKASKQHYVEFLHQSEDSLNSLKQMLIAISPDVAKGSNIETCAKTLQIVYQQVMLLVEDLRIRELLTLQAHPHLILLTNHGLYVCRNATSGQYSPAVLHPSELHVKKWCHIDRVDRITITSPSTSKYLTYTVVIHIRQSKQPFSISKSTKDVNTLCLLIQNSELLNIFLYNFTLLYKERRGIHVPITRD